MYIASTTDPVVAIRAEARRSAGQVLLPVRLYRWLVQVWAHHLERQMERAVIRLEHPDVLSELRAARRRV